MNPTIKSIETRYNGVLFRSRAEARWAFFLDYLSIPWKYEYEGFELRSGRYVPDFWLPTFNGGTWLEIKGQDPTETERLLACELMEATKHDVFIAVGFEQLSPFPVREETADVSIARFYMALRIAGFQAIPEPTADSSVKQIEESWKLWARVIFCDLMAAWRLAEKHRFWNPEERQ
jgi:hypothetical protein